MRLQRDATTRAARTSTRPWAAASTPRFARICLSTRSRRPARRVSPRLVPPQRPRRRVLVPRCPPFPSDDDPLPHSVPGARGTRATRRRSHALHPRPRPAFPPGRRPARVRARARARERRSPLPDGRRGQRPPPGRHPRVVRRSQIHHRTPPETHARRGRRRGGRSAAARAAAPGRPGATAGAERRAARVAAERDAARVAERRRRDAEDAERRLAEDAERRLSSPSASYGSDSTHARFDVPPGHPLLRKYAAGEGAGTRPEGGTTLSEALDFQAARRRARRGEAPAPGDERFGVDTADRAVAGSNPIGDGDDGDGDDGDDVSEDRDDATRRVLKPPPSFGGCAESRALAATISRDICARGIRTFVGATSRAWTRRNVC